MMFQLYMTDPKSDAADSRIYATEAEAREAAWEFLLAGWQVILIRR